MNFHIKVEVTINFQYSLADVISSYESLKGISFDKSTYYQQAGKAAFLCDSHKAYLFFEEVLLRDQRIVRYYRLDDRPSPPPLSEHQVLIAAHLRAGSPVLDVVRKFRHLPGATWVDFYPTPNNSACSAIMYFLITAEAFNNQNGEKALLDDEYVKSYDVLCGDS